MYIYTNYEKNYKMTERDLTRMVRRIIKEVVKVADVDFTFPDDPNEFNKFHLEEIFNIANSAEAATEMIKDHYHGYYFEMTFETVYGKTMEFKSPEGNKIVGKYIIGCCAGAGDFKNRDRFMMSNRHDDVSYNQNKRY